MKQGNKVYVIKNTSQPYNQPDAAKGAAPVIFNRYARGKMITGSRVTLISFNGEESPPADCDPSENYWLLIGKTGTVVSEKNSRARFLIKFDDSVSAIGLYCHNEVSNSLFILEDDLKLTD